MCQAGSVWKFHVYQLLYILDIERLSAGIAEATWYSCCWGACRACETNTVVFGSRCSIPSSRWMWTSRCFNTEEEKFQAITDNDLSTAATIAGQIPSCVKRVIRLTTYFSRDFRWKSVYGLSYDTTRINDGTRKWTICGLFVSVCVRVCVCASQKRYVEKRDDWIRRDVFFKSMSSGLHYEMNSMIGKSRKCWKVW